MNYNLEHKVAQNSILPFFSFDLAYCCLLQCSKLSKKILIMCVKVTHVRTMGISGLVHMGAKVNIRPLPSYTGDHKK